MRTEIIRRKLYKFKELSKKAKEKVLDDNRDYHTRDMEWWDSCYEDAKRCGLEITSFDCYRNQITGTLEITALESIKAILKDHGESCDTYRTASAWKPLFLTALLTRRCQGDEDWEQEDEMMADDYKRELLRDYLKMLEKEYEYLESDECLREHFECGDDEFLASGEMA